ncbi:MAG TPA: hypothetical protein VF221_20290 [Chloroflexota bacterium]
MKRLVLVGGSILALVVGAATAPHAVHAAGVNMVATGGGFSECNSNRGGVDEVGSLCPSDSTGQHFAFNAHEDLTTMAVGGHVVWWFVNGDQTSGKKLLQVGGQVTCIAAVGTAANITFQVSQESGSEQPGVPGSLVGQYLTFGALDNGQPSNNNPNFDMISSLHPAANGADCSGYPPDQKVTYGNISIDPQISLIAVPMSDGATYNVTSAGDVLYNVGDGTGWQTAP